MPRDLTALVDWRRNADSACCLDWSSISFGEDGSGCAVAAVVAFAVVSVVVGLLGLLLRLA